MDSELPPPPPPPSARPPSPPLEGPRGASPGRNDKRSGNALAWFVGIMVILTVGGGSVLFLAGEDLFGSDPGTIDSYNSGVLRSCEIPGGSTLVQASIRPVFDESGQRYRSMWHVYASALSADDVAEFFGVPTGVSELVSPRRACRFGQRPSVLVLSSIEAGDPISIDPNLESAPIVVYHGLWADQASDVTASSEVPAETRSLFRLRLAQREVDGLFGGGAESTPTAQRRGSINQPSELDAV